jgi:UDP-N-acetylmuramoyl-L-alanyl-D-glutamate--2,6-diaminopimelate ligase
MAAVTGTNGKTTTTFLIKHIAEKAALRCGLIGHGPLRDRGACSAAVRTTPEALELQELLAQMVNAGCKAAAMEVSSHAIAQDRTRGLEWDVAVFTNLTQDHLDFHGTMEKYFEAKLQLFTGLAKQERKEEGRRGREISTTATGTRIVERLGDTVPVVTYGMGVHADFRASNYRPEFAAHPINSTPAGRSISCACRLIGRFNVANSLAAIAAANANRYPIATPSQPG